MEATPIGDDGIVATVSLDAGFELTFDPETLEISTPSDNPGDITILVDGSPVVLTPGGRGSLTAVGQQGQSGDGGGGGGADEGNGDNGDGGGDGGSGGGNGDNNGDNGGGGGSGEVDEGNGDNGDG